MSRHFEILQQAGQEQDLFRTEDVAPDAATTATPKQPPHQPDPRAVGKRITLPARWFEGLKQKARIWQEQARTCNNHHAGNVDIITHEEELKLVHRIFRSANGRSPQVVLFSGVEGESGCASICARIGEILAEQPETSVCVVEADLRSPSLHRHFGIENAKGLSDAVLESGHVREFVQRISDRNLWVMPGGSAAHNLDTSLFAHQLQSRLKELRATFQHLVIHSSPFGRSVDPLMLSQWSDGVVLVVEAHATRRATALRVKESLATANVPMLGVVLSNRTFPIPDSIYRKL